MKPGRLTYLLILLLPAIHSCFTGVEVTPKITDRQASRETGAPTAEQKLLASAIGEPPARWVVGKPFTVTEGKVKVAYLPASVSGQLQPGDTLRFAGFSPATTLTGAIQTEVSFTTADGTRLTNRIENPPETVMGASDLVLPFLVELSTVDSVRAILKDRDLWTLTLQRFTLSGQATNGMKYEKVRVGDVRPGTGEYPLEVILKCDDGSEAMVYMTTNPHSHSPRRFQNLFSLSDPRKRFQHISDKNWALICRGQIATDMTMEECRLALGTPKEVERDATYGGLIERWTYENGIYLYFKDGVLTRFRN